MKSPKEASRTSDDREAVLTALAAEHSAMQGVVGASVNEQQARASMFLLSVSGALVALGIVAQTDKFLLFTAALLPALYLIGVLTIMRLVDVGMESIQSEITIAKIRRYYRSLGGPAEALFEEPLGRWPEGKLDSGHVTGPVFGLLTTAASMIACVNGFIGGFGIALLLHHLGPASIALSAVAGAAFVVAQVGLVLAYQNWRINLLARLATDRGLISTDDTG